MWSTPTDRIRAEAEYFRPGGAALDRFESAKAKDADFPHGVHVVINAAGTVEEVWLNTESCDFDGLCVGSGPDAVAEAVRTLETALSILQNPPAPDVYRVRDET